MINKGSAGILGSVAKERSTTRSPRKLALCSFSSDTHLRPQWQNPLHAGLDIDGKGTPAVLEILADNRAIKVPAGPDYTDNFVVGLALDYTSPGAVPHPNPEKEDLNGAPLLLIATSDSMLRCYRFANTGKSLAGVMRTPLILRRPSSLPPAQGCSCHPSQFPINLLVVLIAFFEAYMKRNRRSGSPGEEQCSLLYTTLMREVFI